MSNFENPIGKVLQIFSNAWNKQVILYGPPGTSKTYSSTIIAAAFLAGVEKKVLSNADDITLEKVVRKKLEEELPENVGQSLYKLAKKYLEKDTVKGKYKIVQFHPSYSYEDFVRGISVKLEGKDVTYEVEPKIIEKFCDDNKDADRIVLVIDEINRAPLASVLGELIYGLEYRGQSFDTPYPRKDTGKAALTIPKNLYIIGTMNTADRSIGSMDYAVRRRFAFVSVPSNENCIAGTWTDDFGKAVKALYDQIMERLFSSNLSMDPDLDMNDIKIGHTYFLGDKSKYKDPDAERDYMINYRLEYQIKPIYKEYIKDGLIDKSKLKSFEPNKSIDDIVDEEFDRILLDANLIN